MESDRRLYWIWMAETFGQGSVTAAKLIRKYKDPEIIFTKKFLEMNPQESFTDAELMRITKKIGKPSLVHSAEILSRCGSLHIKVITPESEEFPKRLNQLRDMPMVLYVYGSLPKCNEKLLVTVVGTRTMSDYGRNLAYSFGSGLAFGNAVVVSGMALGTDSMALCGALDAGGEVIAFLGSGVDVIYPSDHRELYKKIVSRGAVVSEYPPGTRPIGRHFPVRNRLMSGISEAVTVVEAGSGSGALITAKHALEQGRKLFAVPGRVGDTGSEGTNLLLVEGALPVISAEDILCEYSFSYQGRISVDNVRASMRGINTEELSENAMNRMRVGTRKDKPNGEKNFYGSGSYGGRAPYDPAKNEPVSIADEGKSAEAKAVKSASSEKKAETKREADAVQTKKKSGILEKIKDKVSAEKKNVAEKTEKKMIPAKKIELDMLDENEIKVYNRMKPDVPMLPDELTDKDCPIGDVLSALTMLEMAGAVEAGSGGYFMRVSPDDIMQSIND